jgi:hypothetical protein
MNTRNSPQTQKSLSRQSSKSNSRAKQEPLSPFSGGGCCRGFTSVKTVASTTSTLQQHQQIQQRNESLEVKVYNNSCFVLMYVKLKYITVLFFIGVGAKVIWGGFNLYIIL